MKIDWACVCCVWTPCRTAVCLKFARPSCRAFSNLGGAPQCCAADFVEGAANPADRCVLERRLEAGHRPHPGRPALAGTFCVQQGGSSVFIMGKGVLPPRLWISSTLHAFHPHFTATPAPGAAVEWQAHWPRALPSCACLANRGFVRVDMPSFQLKEVSPIDVP